MKQTRKFMLFALLAGVLVVRWVDPLSQRRAQSEPDVAAAVVKPVKAQASEPTVAAAAVAKPLWPVREAAERSPYGNAFMTRGEVAQQEAQRQQAKMAKQPVYIPPPPPPPPPPPEPAPPVQVIGTWGNSQDLAVFLATPNGTLLAHQGDTLMASYRVQAINAQRVTLVQTSNQKIWMLDIPSAPNQLQTWPAR